MGAFTNTFGIGAGQGSVLNQIWLLITGYWKDNSRWDDNAVWID